MWLESLQMTSQNISNNLKLGCPLSRRPAVFGFQGGESPDTVARKEGYMKDAQHQWRFLTNYDLSTIKTGGQLCSMVKTRSGSTEEQAKRDVDAWIEGKQF